MGAQGTPEILTQASHDAFDTLLDEERTRLVRFCVRLTGNPGVAEDLAQETLLEAWRNQQKLNVQDRVHPENCGRWLAAIARNVCLRWGRSYGRDLAHLVQYTLSATNDEGESEMDLDELPSGAMDLTVELERDELARLLDRALALLPPTTRAVLIERYIHESPHHEIAERLGLSEDALVQRLYRGKLALRSVMENELNAEAAAYGLVAQQIPGEEPLEQETRIWCPFCNKCRLVKYHDPVRDWTGFTCPGCWHFAAQPNAFSPHWDGLHNPKAILNRQLTLLSEYYWQAATHHYATCYSCGETIPAHILSDRSKHPSAYGSTPIYPGVYIHCDHCNDTEINGLPHMTMDVPESQQFWRQHPRMFWLPPREIDYANQPALLSGFQSYSDSARLDIIYQPETLKILGIHETTC